MSSAMKVSCVWALVCLVLVVTAGMLHHNTVRVMTEDTDHWLSLATKTLDAAFENEQALVAIVTDQRKVITSLSRCIDVYGDLCERSYEEIYDIRLGCEAALTQIKRTGYGDYHGALCDVVELLQARVLHLEKCLSHTVRIDDINSEATEDE